MRAVITVKLSEKRGRYKAVISAPGQQTQTHTFSTREEMEERACACLHAAADLMFEGKITAIRTVQQAA